MLEQVLIGDEIGRAEQFSFNHLREAFVITRGILRYLLGRYLNLHPSCIRFIYGAKGKPSVESLTPVQFNMTHSGNLAAVAITSHCSIGIDLERIRPMPDIHQIASHFFCSGETAEIMSFSPSERERAFFHCWTRKEAYIKALGEGLYTPLDSFRVTVQPNTPARIVHIEQDTSEADEWTLHDLCLATDYAAALAYRDRERSLSIFPIVDLAEFFDTM
ncbi:MAG: 4'-phosphopantetheinyl transferase superfamily protein [Terracidiphilus sp.]